MSSASHHDLLLERLQTLEPNSLEIIDESHLHAGHAGAKGGASHFRVHISSPKFAGLNTLARHRLVMECVQDIMPFPIHALAVKAELTT